jgi:hypothetical protein
MAVAVSAVAVEILCATVRGVESDLREMAQEDSRCQYAIGLAAELRTELERLSDPAAPAHAVRVRTRRRTTRAAPRRARPTATRTTIAEEYQALAQVIQRADGEDAEFSSRRVADLRLDERTRNVLTAAGLHEVRQVAALSADQLTNIPELSPRTLAELRAAIMFALDIEEAPHQPMLPAAQEGEDLFDGVVQTVNQLPRYERETVVLRTGTTDRVHSVEEVAEALGCPADQVPILERHALNLLLSQPASLEASWRLEGLCAKYGLGWEDERLQKLIAARYPKTRANFTRLVAWLTREKSRLAAEAAGRSFVEPGGIAHFDEMVIAALGRYGDMSADQLNRQLHAALPPADRAMYPDIEVAERVQILGPAVQRDDGTFCLPDSPVPGVDDRHIRALNGLIGALQKLGSARISALTTEVNRRLPRQFHINDQYVRTWLTRNPELFVQSDVDRFKLASLDVDILCGLAKSWTPGSTAPAVAVGLGRSGGVGAAQQHERVAKAIAEFLGREGPQPIWKIRSHLYGRIIGPASADSVIAAYPNQFVKQKGGEIALRAADDPKTEVTEVIAPPSRPRRPRLWPQRASSP